jgi:transposase
MPNSASNQIAIIGIDVGKNSFHIVGLDKRGAIVLRQKWSRGQVEARLANTALPDRHGGLRRRASSQLQAE